MKQVQVIHNPRAGEEKYTKKELLALLKENGYHCRYFSTKEKGWRALDAKADILLIAGGDGTVRKVAGRILKTKLLNKPDHLALLPLGTANNISKALKLKDDPKKIIRSWDDWKIQSFDVGRVFGVTGHDFFLESFGYGAFPRLMQEMEKLDPESLQSPEESLNTALEELEKIILSYEPRNCQVQVDGKDHSGKFIMVEVMNIPSIGPNLHISPTSDTGDGEFEVVLVGEKDRKKLAAYVAGRRKGKKDKLPFKALKGKEISISCECAHVHIDDQLVDLEKGAGVDIQVKRNLLNFLV